MATSKFMPKGGKAKTKTRRFSKIPQFWSFSRWEDFNKCPWSYALKHIAKVRTPEEVVYAFERGNAIHKLSENYILGNIKRVPKELAQFAGEFKAVRLLGAIAEADYTVNKEWKACAGDDFVSAWLRAKLDIVILGDELTLIDIKTGRYREIHELQGEIYAMCALEREPDYDNCDVEFWNVDDGQTYPFSYARSGLKKLKAEWMKRIKPMLEGRLFTKTPSKYACTYCKFRTDKVLANGEPGECDEWRGVVSS